VACGGAWAGAGLVFTGVTAVAAQLTSTTRGCGAWAFGALGVAYLLRAVGDTAGGAASALTWLSPLGWAQKVEPFGADRLVVGLLPLGTSVVLVALAFLLRDRRDLGAGLLPVRPGPAGGAPSLRSPWALAWRLQRAGLAGWAVAYAVLGAVLGGVAGSVAELASGPQMQDLLRRLGGGAGSLTDTFVSTEVQFLAIGAAAYGNSAALRLRSEETDQHTEQVLATGTGRAEVLASHGVIALGGSAALMVLLGVAFAVPTGGLYGGFGAAGRLPRLGRPRAVRRRRRARAAVRPPAAGRGRLPLRARRRPARVGGRRDPARRAPRDRRRARRRRRRDLPPPRHRVTTGQARVLPW
jgi:ABC-2 type transport system permease protein